MLCSTLIPINIAIEFNIIILYTTASDEVLLYKIRLLYLCFDEFASLIRIDNCYKSVKTIEQLVLPYSKKGECIYIYIYTYILY